MQKCKDTKHSFLPLDLTKRTMEPIDPEYVLFCQKCGMTTGVVQKEGKAVSV